MLHVKLKWFCWFVQKLEPLCFLLLIWPCWYFWLEIYLQKKKQQCICWKYLLQYATVSIALNAQTEICAMYTGNCAHWFFSITALVISSTVNTGFCGNMENWLYLYQGNVTSGRAHYTFLLWLAKENVGYNALAHCTG